MMSSSVRLMFINTDIILFFAVYSRVRPVFTYFTKPILASQWVNQLLKIKKMLRNWRIDMMLWSPYFRVDTKMFEYISWWTKKRRNLGFLFVITLNLLVYVVPMWNSTGWLMVVSLIVIDIEGSRSFSTTNSVRYFAGRFTKVSESELPNSMVTGVT